MAAGIVWCAAIRSRQVAGPPERPVAREEIMLVEKVLPKASWRNPCTSDGRLRLPSVMVIGGRILYYLLLTLVFGR